MCHLRHLRSSSINALVDQYLHDRDAMEIDFRECKSADVFLVRLAWFADTSVEKLMSDYIKHFSLGSKIIVGAASLRPRST